MTEQIIQFAGALLVLAGFAGSQAGWFDIRSRRYLAINALGSGILAAIAILEREWGFILLESVWTVVSLASLLSLGTRRRTTP